MTTDPQLALAVLVLAVVLELGAVPLGFGFVSPSLGLAAGACALPGVGLPWALVAVGLALAVRTCLRGSPALGARPQEFLSDFLPAALGAWGVHLLGPLWSWPVLALLAVPLPIVLLSRWVPGSQALRVREELALEQLALASLGSLAALLGVSWGLLVLVPVALGLRHSVRTRAELGRHQSSQALVRHERREITRQARSLDRTAEEQRRVDQLLDGRARAFAMLEQLSARPLAEREALEESLRALAANLPGCRCAFFDPQKQLVVGDPVEGSHVWPVGEVGYLWVHTPVELAPDSLATLGTFARYVGLLLERASSWQRELALRTQVTARAERLQALLEATPALAAADAPATLLEHAVTTSSRLSAGRVWGAQALGVTTGQAPAWAGESLPLGALGRLYCEGPSLQADEREALTLWSCLVAAGLERLQAQAGLVQGSKLAAIGQMAAGVAHELNTPLGAVTIAVDVALGSLESRPERARSRLEQALDALEKMRSIVAKLLYYARTTGQGRVPTNLAEVARDCLRLLRIEEVELQTDLEDVTCSVDPGEIQQVLINLLVNARQAVTEPGARASRVAVRCGPLGPDHALLEVEDWGPGISAEIAERIFEPFFTTKPVGQGTGLGLSLSVEIARHHAGTLTWRPTPQGVIFRLELPR